MSLRDLFFFARGRQVLSVIDKRSRNILDSRVYLGYRISEVRGENKGILQIDANRLFGLSAVFAF